MKTAPICAGFENANFSFGSVNYFSGKPHFAQWAFRRSRPAPFSAQLFAIFAKLSTLFHFDLVVARNTQHRRRAAGGAPRPVRENAIRMAKMPPVRSRGCRL